MPPKPNKGTPTQSHIPFGAVYQDTVVMKGGGFRQIVLVSSINFGLKSEEEQNSIVYAFQAALNSFDFPVQILIRSRQIDLGEYLEALKKKVYEQTNELIRYQTQEYIDFISRLISVANIMDKKFFVVIAANHAPTKQGLFGPKTGLLTVTLKEFETVKKELAQRVEVVQQSLASLGLKSVLLTTEQIIELMYSSYNITESMREKLQNTEELAQTTIIEQVEGAPVANGPVPSPSQPGPPIGVPTAQANTQPATNPPAAPANNQPPAGSIPVGQSPATPYETNPAVQYASAVPAQTATQYPAGNPVQPASPPAPATAPDTSGYSAIPPLTPPQPNVNPVNAVDALTSNQTVFPTAGATAVQPATPSQVPSAPLPVQNVPIKSGS